MHTIIATYSVRYFWDIPNFVRLLPANSPHRKEEVEGAWYITHGVLHYLWAGKWRDIEGTEDGFVNASPDDAEFAED
jgi:hypothetical protein